jgi:stringent starvation protein B
MTRVDMDGDVPSTPRQLLENLLGQGMVMVTVDARADGAIVPRQFERDPQLRLNLSYRFGLPIEVDEWGVKARLTFSGVPFDCEMPWPSIYMIVSHVTGQPFLFPEHVPQELMQLATQMRSEAAEELPKKPRLTVVGSSDDSAETDAEAEIEVAAEPEIEAAPEPAAVVVEDTPVEPQAEPEAVAEATPESDPPRTPPRRGHLRVVK